MSKAKNKPGIHLYKTEAIKTVTSIQKRKGMKSDLFVADQWYWHAVSKNGHITSSGRGLNTKASALKSIRSTAITMGGNGKFEYFDHSKPNSPKVKYV